MTTNIKLRRSAVNGNIPTTGQLDLGEVAINTFDGIIYIKKDNGAQSIIPFPEVTTTFIAGLGALMDSEVTNLAQVKSFNSADYATSAQGILAGSALQAGDIGVSVQAYSSVLQNTTASYTTTEETKLSTIETSATADQTAAEILSALLTVDGTSSALDADLLDGQHGSHYLDYNNFTNTPLSSGGIVWSVKTSNYTAVNNDGIIANTSGGTFTVTLPASPATGTNVVIADGGSWSTVNLTVGRNGSTIEGAAEDLVLDISTIQVHLIYSGTTWEVYAFTGAASTVLDDTTTNATKYITWNDNTSGLYDAKVSSTKLFFNPSNGTLTSTDYNSLSDRRLKENINDIKVDYDMLNSIRSVSFDWKDSGKSAYGFIAQEIEEIMPEIVNENEETSYKSVSYTQLIPHLLEAIKDLKRQVDELKEKK